MLRRAFCALALMLSASRWQKTHSVSKGEWRWISWALYMRRRMGEGREWSLLFASTCCQVLRLAVKGIEGNKIKKI